MYTRKINRFFCRRKRLKSTFVYNQSDVNQIVWATSIVEIISDFINLNKTKSAFVGRCPFCKWVTKNNKHFRVSEKFGYKCFECGSGGKTSHSFIMRYYNVPFDTAIEFINRTYYKGNCKLRIERNVVDKSKNIEDEDCPF